MTGSLDLPLLERLVVQPFFGRLRDLVHGQLRGFLHLPPANDYAAGRLETPDGLQLTICAAAAGDDQYASTFSVRFELEADGVHVRLSGQVAIYRHVRTEAGGCTAQAEESLELAWSGTLSVAPARAADGGPALAVARTMSIGGATREREENDCARALHARPGAGARLAGLPELDLSPLAGSGRELVPIPAPARFA